MDNFIFDGASRVIFGKGAENGLAGEIKRLNGKKVFLHYGMGSIKLSGLYDKVIKLLKDGGLDVVEQGGVKPNPVVSHVREGIKICRDAKADFILAVGGGSVIDSAKAIAVGVPYSGDVWDFAESKVAPKTALPIGVILTIPAAGSETSRYSVVTNEDGMWKRDVVNENLELIRPKFAILNPELTLKLPPFETACGTVDILAHVMERYFSRTINVDLSDKLCEAVMKSVIKNGPIAVKEPGNYDARAEIMWAGSIAHNDLIGMGRSGDWVSHRIGVELSALYDIAHGASLSIAFPAWMKFMYKLYPVIFAKFAVNVWNIDNNFDSVENTALEGIKRLESFYKEIGMPISLTEAKIPLDKFEVLAEKCDKIGNIKKIDKKDVIEILNLAI
ncbi:MAG: iron-containing alcohol dehydrogenase [Candidatus Humimicrobiaceae bacterium]